jgi:hypothetical protein
MYKIRDAEKRYLDFWIPMADVEVGEYVEPEN